MTTSQLVFIGIKGSVIALHAQTGQQAWGVHLSGANFVNVQVQDGKIIAACNGEIFCLEAATGRILWQNGLKGFGFGLATLAVEPNCGSAAQAALAEKVFFPRGPVVFSPPTAPLGRGVPTSLRD